MKKLQYDSPELVVHGSVEDLTQVVGSGSSDMITGPGITGNGAGSSDLTCDIISGSLSCQ